MDSCMHNFDHSREDNDQHFLRMNASNGGEIMIKALHE
jgi:hypothetical protein